ncbi:DUF4394 domain-containing protein [Williamsia sp. CHRR-6]|uniref:DUF4394 domain-containing protein n=1 Tax=Williamsia sp. CHRR-6 TaxID=2835871 RepID=UPI001BDAD22A|nr:DUF4394 domain-containing protein [Williamsia sp. CHRR-6]MBT0567763.1 DUF4394 domain-containing protein [Williamsia sp. CHRR-6]
MRTRPTLVTRPTLLTRAALAGAGAALLIGSAAAVGTSTAGATVGGTTVFGLSSDGRTLSQFTTSTPRFVRTVGAVTGLPAGEKLIGIDVRPATGALYGVSNTGGVYTISRSVATKVSQLSVALEGTAFGVDFNPAADRLRIISDTGQSLRHDVTQATPMTAVDTAVNYTAGTPVTGIQAVGYTNNDTSAATATALYDIDTTQDQLVLQVPPNAGTLVPVGKLGIDFASVTSFDIASTVRGTTATGNTGYLLGTPVGGSKALYKVDLTTGQVAKVGPIGGNVAQIAVTHR